MDVDGTNQAFGAVVSSLAPLNGSFSGLQGEGVSSLQQSEQGLTSSELLENGKQAKVRDSSDAQQGMRRAVRTGCQIQVARDSAFSSCHFFAGPQAIHNQQDARTLVRG